MPATFRTTWTILVVCLLGAFATAVIVTANLVASPDAAAHALFHLPAGLLAAIAAIAVARLWTSRSRIGRVGTTTLVLALWIFAFGQFAESVGAFGWIDEQERYRTLTSLHDVGVFGTPLGLFTALLVAPWCISGVIARVAASQRARIVRVSVPMNLALNVGAVLFVLLVVTGR